MANLTTDALTVRGRDGLNWEQLEALTYKSLASGVIIAISGVRQGIHATLPGTTTDGASTPSFLWSLGLPPFGWYWLACVLHDALYRMTTRPVIPTREECDHILLEAMNDLWPLAQQLGVPRVTFERQRDAIYAGVRAGGLAAFWKDRAH